MPDNILHSEHRKRMRARFRINNSLDGFAEHEVLEMLLYSALQRVNTNETAHALLKKFGNIRTVLSADLSELCQVKGVGTNCAEHLIFLGKVFQLAERESFVSVQADDFESVSAYLQNFYYADTIERLCAFSVNGAGRITGCSVLSVGVTDRVSFDVEELKRFLIYNNAESLLISHNHPHNTAAPTPEDILLTRNIQTFLHEKVTLLDHIIVGANDVMSLRAMGYFRAYE